MSSNQHVTRLLCLSIAIHFLFGPLSKVKTFSDSQSHKNGMDLFFIVVEKGRCMLWLSSCCNATSEKHSESDVLEKYPIYHIYNKNFLCELYNHHLAKKSKINTA